MFCERFDKAVERLYICARVCGPFRSDTKCLKLRASYESIIGFLCTKHIAGKCLNQINMTEFHNKKFIRNNRRHQ